MALNSKRMQTFFNEFLITTTTFLNQFANDCEDKFINLERKLNKIESNLVIIEEKLASVPGEERSVPVNLPEIEALKPLEKANETPADVVPPPPVKNEVPEPQPQIVEPAEPPQPEPVNENLIKICESSVYRKYFKMLKFGIPPPAVKQKMTSEGLDADLLDNPDLLIDKTPEDDEEQ